MTEPEINSQSYWEQRFREDWESSEGREQSRFFAALALEAFPNWLASAIRDNGWSICDWGCAEGDGTAVLAEAFPANRITGVDFSQAAVDAARQRYELGFLAEDWLADEPASDRAAACWDLVFSSNTLEHFPDPAGVLSRLCERASRCVVLLVPYQEWDRHPEHEATFTAGNIGFVPQTGYALCFTAIINASTRQPTYWSGEQVLLVYCRLEDAARLDLTAQEVIVCLSEPEEVDASGGEPGIRDARALQLGTRIRQLQADLAARNEHIGSLVAEVRALNSRSQELADQVRKQDARSQELASTVREKDALIRELAETHRQERALLEGRMAELAEESARESASARQWAERCSQLDQELASARRNPLRLWFGRRR